MSNTAFGEIAVAPFTPMAGWTFAYNVNADLVTSTVTGSGEVTHDDNFAVLNTTAAASSSAKIETKLPVRYIPGQGGLVRFTAIFTEGVAGSTQVIGIGDGNDGLFFGFNGADFGILRRRGGTDYWTPQSEWINRRDGTSNTWISDIDPTKLNVYQIQFQWLGGGEMRFSVENRDTGGFEPVHYIEYAGLNNETSILNPTLPVMAQVINDANDTAITLKSPSMMGGCEGMVENPQPPHPLALPRTLTASDTGITTQNNVLTLSNQATWQSITNRIRSQVRKLSVATDGTKAVTIRLVKDTTLGGTPSYSDFSANTSPIQYDTAGTTLTGGTVVFAAVLDKVDAQVFDLDGWGIFLSPGEKLTVSAESASSVDITMAVHWVDLL